MHIVIGAVGWAHEQWQGHFYPDDIPLDWRLSYYANEFESVLVPFEMWSQCELEEIESWFEDLPEDFELFFEVDSDSCNGSSNKTVKKMLSHELFTHRQVKFSPKSLGVTPANCTMQQGMILDCVLDSVPSGERIALIRISSEDVIKVDEIRQIIDRAHDECREIDTLYLFFDQALLDVSLLNTARIIVDLLVVDD